MPGSYLRFGPAASPHRHLCSGRLFWKSSDTGPPWEDLLVCKACCRLRLGRRLLGPVMRLLRPTCRGICPPETTGVLNALSPASTTAIGTRQNPGHPMNKPKSQLDLRIRRCAGIRIPQRARHRLFIWSGRTCTPGWTGEEFSRNRMIEGTKIRAYLQR